MFKFNQQVMFQRVDGTGTRAGRYVGSVDDGQSLLIECETGHVTRRVGTGTKVHKEIVRVPASACHAVPMPSGIPGKSL